MNRNETWLRRSLGAFAALSALAVATPCARADGWEPQDVVAQRHRAEIAALATDTLPLTEFLQVRVEDLRPLAVVVDLPAAGGGDDTPFARIWLSDGDRSGAFGRRWVAPWDERLIEGQGAPRLALADGGTLEFQPADGGTFVAKKGPSGRLAALPEGGWRWTCDDAVREYDVQGRLVAVRRPSEATTFAYDGAGRIRSLSGAIDVALELDAEGRVATAKTPDGRVASYRYGNAGELLAVERPDGTKLLYAYDTAFRLKRAAVEAGPSVQLAYADDGSLARADGPGAAFVGFARRRDGATVHVASSNAVGAVRTWTFDRRRRETASFGPGLDWERKVYDASGRLVRHRRAGVPETDIAYDAAGRIRTVARSGRGEEAFAYDAAGRLASVTGPAGTVRATYNAAGLIETFTDEAGGVVRYAYDERGHLAAIVRPDGAKVEIACDAAGRLTGLVSPDGGKESFGYDAAGRLVSVDDAYGKRRLAYDAQGRLASVVDPDGSTTRIKYKPRERRIEAPAGSVTVQELDEAGRLVRETVEPGQRVRTFRRDAFGRVVAIVDPDGGTRRFAYDASGNLSEVVGAGGTRTAFAQSPDGALLGLAQNGGESLEFVRDAGGRLVRTVSNRRGPVDFESDERGRLVAAKPAGGDATTYAYDAAGRIASIRLGADEYRRDHAPDGRSVVLRMPLGGEWRTEFDADGLPVRRTGPGVGETRLAYDAAGRIVKSVTPLRTTEIVYDAAGRAAEWIVDGKTLRAHRFDAQGRMVGADLPGGALQFGYDAAGELASKTDLRAKRTLAFESRHGLWTKVALDADRAILRTRAQGGATTRIEGPSGASVRLTRDAAGRLSRVELGASVEAVYAYETNGLPREIVWRKTDAGRTVLYRLAYTYDAAGRIAVADHNGRVTRYRYDGRGRIVAATAAGGPSEAFAYDADNNLAGDGTATWTCSPADQIVRSSVGDFSYDAEGRLVEGAVLAGRVRCEYDAEGRLARVRVGDRTVAYAYGVGGELRRRTEGGAVREFETLDGNVVAEWRDGALDTVHLTGDALDERHGWVKDGKAFYCVADPFGSVLAVIDAEGRLCGRRAYRAFGQAVEESGTLPEFAFQGHWRDPLTGWLYLRSRWYDPASGRFVQPDTQDGTFEEPATLNRYAFVFNDPVNRVDPWGYGPWIKPTIIPTTPGLCESSAVQQAFKQFMKTPPPPSGSSLSTMAPKGFQPGNYNAFGYDGIAYDVWVRTLPNGQYEVSFRPFAEADGGYYSDPTKIQAHIEAGKMKGPGTPPIEPVAPPSKINWSATGLKVVRAGGKVLLVYGAYRSLRNIYESSDWRNQLGREASGWGMGWAMGVKGAAWGTMLTGGPWGGVIGGFAGGVSGYFVGSGAYDWLTGTADDAHYISVALDQSDWYCTNRPEIESAVNLPDILAHERKRRLEAIEKARRTEAEIRAAADREAERLQAEFERLLAGLQEEMDDAYAPLKRAGNYSGGQLNLMEEQCRRRAEGIRQRADELKARHAQTLRNLVVKTGRDVDKVRGGLRAELPPLPPPVIPPVAGPFGRPYGEPLIGVHR